MPEELLAEAGFLRRLAREIVRDTHDADEIVQHTMMLALEHPPRREGPLRGWLAMVATNLARTLKRANARRSEREHRVARAESSECDESALERLELQRELFDLVLTLPDEQRTVLYLRYYEGRTPSDIAAHLGQPIKTVKSRHTRAVASLRRKLDARSNGDRGRWMNGLAALSIPRVSWWKAIVGGVVMKKLVVTAALILFAALAWLAYDHQRSAQPMGAGPVRGLTNTEPLASESAGLAPDAQVGREPLRSIASTSTGALDVHLSWSDGAPAAGIGIDARCDADPAPRAEYFRASTNAAGIARFDALFAGNVTLRPDLHASFDAKVEAGSTRTVEHTIEGGLRIEGQVLGPDGAAVDSAWISCTYRRANGGDVKLAIPCAADGSFVLRDVSRDAAIGGRARGHRPSACVRAADVPIGASGARTIAFALGASGGRLAGRVLDPDGAPVAHARVLAGERGGFQASVPQHISAAGAVPAPAETDEKGRFEILDDLQPSASLVNGTPGQFVGPQPVYATARGFPVWRGEVTIVAGELTTLDIHLQHSARIEGRLLSVDGRPTSGVRVLASKEENGGWYWDPFPASETRTDVEGAFVLDWIAPGPCELSASDFAHPEIGRAHSVVECLAGQTIKCDLRLERGNVIEGRVVDGDGAPLSGWHVYSESSVFFPHGYPRRATTSADGRFALLNLGSGTHDLIVRAPKPGVPRAHLGGVEVGRSEVVIVVQDAQTLAGTIRGRVTDPNARSIADAIVVLFREGGREGHFIPMDASTGAFEGQTVPGEYRIEIRRGTRAVYTSAVITVAEGGISEVGDLVLEPAGRIEVTLRGIAEPEVAGRLVLESDDGRRTMELEPSEGIWRSEDVMPGHWRVTTHEHQLWLRDADVTVVSAVTTRTEVQVEAAIPVQLTMAIGNSIDPFTIEACDAGGKFLRREMVGFESPDGRARYSLGLPSGHARVTVRAPDGRIGTLDVDVNETLRDAKAFEVVLH